MNDHLQMPRIIAVDLDGTILTRDKQVSPRTLSALKSCQLQGIRLAFVTGRAYGRAREFMERIEPDAAVLDGLALSGSSVGADSAQQIDTWLSGLHLR